jgi:hypothetical protein
LGWASLTPILSIPLILSNSSNSLCLCVSVVSVPMHDADIPQPTPEERELSRKLAELSELEETLAQKELALSTLQVELHVFEVRYLDTVGKRYAELDEVEADIAELQASLEPHNTELVERAESARARAQESADALDAGRDLPVRRAGPPSESLKKLFRKVARVIHPDLAEDEEVRAKRQTLMAAANRAYLAGDEEGLASVLKEWEESPETVVGHGTAAELLRAIRQIARVQTRIEAIEQEIAALRDGELYRLRDRVEAAEAAGRDLLAEMAAALEPQIAAARARLAALEQEGNAP